MADLVLFHNLTQYLYKVTRPAKCRSQLKVLQRSKVLVQKDGDKIQSFDFSEVISVSKVTLKPISTTLHFPL